MPTINAKDLGLTPQEARMTFSGLTRNQAVAKISQIQEEQKLKKMSEQTSSIINEMSQQGVPAEEVSKAITATKDLDQGTRESVLRSYIESKNKGAQPTELGIEASGRATEILNDFENKGIGKLAVGKSRAPFGWIASMLPGTESGDFTKKVNSLKSALSADASKYLKGQGAMSDAERQMLSEAVSDLSVSQSEEAFKKSVQDIINKLNPKGSGESAKSGVTSSGIKFTIE